MSNCRLIVRVSLASSQVRNFAVKLLLGSDSSFKGEYLQYNLGKYLLSAAEAEAEIMTSSSGSAGSLWSCRFKIHVLHQLVSAHS